MLKMNRITCFLLAAAGLLGCRKDDVVVCATATLADLRAAAPAVQSFTFTLSQAQSLRTAFGATLAFGANAFILPNGAVATGQAQVRLRELHSVGDILLAGLHTNVSISSKQLLVSAGEFNIQIWQGSTRLRWNPASSVATSPLPTGPSLTTPVPQSGLDTTRMYLWQLPFPANPAAAAVADSMGWQPALQRNGASALAWKALLPTNGAYSALLALDSISWLNFDQFWRPASNAVWSWANVKVPAGATETQVYLRPAGYTSLCRTFGTPNDPMRWRNHFPDGTVVQAIVLQARNGQLYFGTQTYTWQANAVMSPALEALSAEEVARRIRQL